METALSPRRSRRISAFDLSILAGVALCALAGPASGQGDSWDGLSEMRAPRRLLTAAAEGGKIYTFGGCGSPCFAPPLHTSTFEETRVEVYDPRLESPGSNPWSVRKPIPAIVFGAAAAAPGNRRIYLFGGFVSGNTVLEYNPEADSWTPKAPMPTLRHGLAAVALDGKVYVLGGSNGSAATNALEVYDPELDSWSRKAPMPTARVFLGAAAVNGRIYAIGGSPDCCGEGRTNAVEVYDPVIDRWDRAASLPVALQVSAAAALGGRIYVFGGFIPGSGVQDFTFEYDPDANKWAERQPMPAKRDQAPAVVLGTRIHVLGGSINCHCRALSDHHAYSPGPDLQITKDDGLTVVSPGQRITYTITARNAGPVPVTGAIVRDTPPKELAGFTWACTVVRRARRTLPCPRAGEPLTDRVDLEVGGQIDYTLTGTVDPNAKDTILNEAEIIPPEGIRDPAPGNNIARDLDRIASTSCRRVTIEKTDGRTKAAPGETLLYEIKVRNHCPAPVQATVTDDLAAAGLEGVRWCRGAGCTPSTEGNINQTVPVPANGTVTYRASGTVPCDCKRKEIRNTASVKVPGRPEISATDTDSIMPAPDGDVALVLTGPGDLRDCDAIPFTATVTNPGPGTACGVVLEGPASTGFDLVSISPPCAAGFPCMLGNMAPDSVIAVTAVFKTRAGSLCGATERITAAVESGCGSSDESALETVIPCDLSITKAAEVTPVVCGDSSLFYTIEVANRSCGAVSKARVTDAFPPELAQVRWCRGKDCAPVRTENPLVDTLDLPAGGTETYRATGAVPFLFKGSLENTASVSPPVGAPPDPTPEDDTATEETHIVFPLGVTVCCTGISGIPAEGETITKFFVLRNGGPLVQGDNPGPEFEDTLPAGLTLVGATASTGTITTAANTVSWNGTIGLGEAVTIEIMATIDAGTLGMILCNEGMVSFDADGDGTNESSATGECCFEVLPVPPIPALSGPGLAALVLLLAALALHRMRRHGLSR